jgi:hypothetical protein
MKSDSKTSIGPDPSLAKSRSRSRTRTRTRTRKDNHSESRTRKDTADPHSLSHVFGVAAPTPIPPRPVASDIQQQLLQAQATMDSTVADFMAKHKSALVTTAGSSSLKKRRSRRK